MEGADYVGLNQCTYFLLHPKSKQEELTGSRRGRRPASGIPGVPSRGRGRGRGRRAAAAAASEGTAGGAPTHSSGGGRSRRSRRVTAAKSSGARSGRSGFEGGSFMSDEDWSEGEEDEDDEEDEEAGGGEVGSGSCFFGRGQWLMVGCLCVWKLRPTARADAMC
jgi:hypothetical protein